MSHANDVPRWLDEVPICSLQAPGTLGDGQTRALTCSCLRHTVLPFSGKPSAGLGSQCLAIFGLLKDLSHAGETTWQRSGTTWDFLSAH